MLDPDYAHTRETLANYLEDFKQLEQDEPEVASRLGFAGYVQFQDTRLYQNERFEQLERLIQFHEGQQPKP